VRKKTYEKFAFIPEPLPVKPDKTKKRYSVSWGKGLRKKREWTLYTKLPTSLRPAIRESGLKRREASKEGGPFPGLLLTPILG